MIVVGVEVAAVVIAAALDDDADADEDDSSVVGRFEELCQAAFGTLSMSVSAVLAASLDKLLRFKRNTSLETNELY